MEFKRFFDIAEVKNWKLSDIENIFYLFSGYAMFWEVMEVPDKKEAKEQGIEETNYEMIEDEDEASEGSNEGPDEE